MFKQLPPDVERYLFTFLAYRELCLLRRVNSGFLTILKDNRFWKQFLNLEKNSHESSDFHELLIRRYTDKWEIVPGSERYLPSRDCLQVSITKQNLSLVQYFVNVGSFVDMDIVEAAIYRCPKAVKYLLNHTPESSDLPGIYETLDLAISLCKEDVIPHLVSRLGNLDNICEYFPNLHSRDQVYEIIKHRLYDEYWKTKFFPWKNSSRTKVISLLKDQSYLTDFEKTFRTVYFREKLFFFITTIIFSVIISCLNSFQHNILSQQAGYPILNFRTYSLIRSALIIIFLLLPSLFGGISMLCFLVRFQIH